MNIHSTPNIPKARQMTQERLKEVLHYDPDTGAFNWLQQRPGCVPGREVGTIACGYRQIEVDYKLFRASRLAWLYITGNWPENLVDHKNGNRSDDRWCNLRAATHQENSRNRKPCKRNKSGKVGVCVGTKPNTWEANITIDNKLLQLGCFEVKKDAITARCKAEKHYFGAFAARRVSDE